LGDSLGPAGSLIDDGSRPPSQGPMGDLTSWLD
jgi:hypothetical protein